jgi:hypothetical protein
VLIMKRTDLVVPEDVVPSLHVPAVAITDGTADPEWVQVPLSRWHLKRRPSRRLPLDARSARSLRRYVRLTPWTAPVLLIGLAAWSVWAFTDLRWPWSMIPLTIGGLTPWGWSQLRTHGVPRHLPYLTRFGDLRIPDVPAEVAQEWIARNPGVTATDEPAPRPHSRLFYAVWAVSLTLAAIALVAVLANDRREDFLLLWALAPVLLVTGVSLALKTQPPAKPGTGLFWPS